MKPELLEDVPDMSLDGLRTEEELVADPAVGMALGHQREHLALALAQVFEGAALPLAAHQASDDRRVDHALALPDPPDRISEDGDLRDPLLEQVADPLGI